MQAINSGKCTDITVMGIVLRTWQVEKCYINTHFISSIFLHSVSAYWTNSPSQVTCYPILVINISEP